MNIKSPLPFDMEETLHAIASNEQVQKLYNKLLRSVRNKEQRDTEFQIFVVKDDLKTQAAVGSLRHRLRTLLSLIPENSLNRKHISTISILDTHWFRKEATYDNINDVSLFPNGPITDNPEEAASEFSLPWGMATWIDANPYSSLMTIYMLIESYDVEAIELYLAYTFFHEIGHLLSDAAYYSLYYAKHFLGLENRDEKRNTYTLTLPKGDQISGNQYISSFAYLAEKYGPFGSYTAGYSKEQDEELWLRESFADATAAYFMGFMMYPEKDFTPLHPEVHAYIHDFYHAIATIERA